MRVENWGTHKEPMFWSIIMMPVWVVIVILVTLGIVILFGGIDPTAPHPCEQYRYEPVSELPANCLSYYDGIGRTHR